MKHVRCTGDTPRGGAGLLDHRLDRAAFARDGSRVLTVGVDYTRLVTLAPLHYCRLTITRAP